MVLPSFPSPSFSLARLARAREGIAAVEFAFIAPLFVLLMAGVSDVSLFIIKRMKADAAVSSAANQALTSGAGLTSSTADSTANLLAAILRAPDPGGTARILINGSRQYDVTATTITASGPASAADECRCPTSSGGTITWGGAVSCTSTCASGAPAGKYVSIAYNRPYKTMFPNYGVIPGNGITIQTAAQVQ
ncbi:hypothetical protein BJF92_11990 [Rhizobium rhizosphaerae]|uniref:TadE-like domain-containing protein n=1 Tax=Xaviernesmea rhizosphaerae TaxID=1672749 RepID=A0A1Q9AN76_9HYPH|nr:TadE/TadG family type IV pilus assembly protein [Xaviernesmea rhizosphaerae]OLP56786.1 hypothetical protein BJF92_11990 [Xaviernesmea rhizosphaerae]